MPASKRYLAEQLSCMRVLVCRDQWRAWHPRQLTVAGRVVNKHFLLIVNAFLFPAAYNNSINFSIGNIVDTDNHALSRRLLKMEAAKSQTRKIAYTLFAFAVTSFIVVITGSAV